MSKLLHRFLLMGALLMCAAGCSDDKTEDSTAPSFSITVPASEFYQATVAESAKAGDVVPLSIKMTEGMEIVSVHYNEEPCTFTSSDAETNTFNYEFTMPEADVTLDIEVREIKPQEYTIYYDNPDNFYFQNVPQTAEEGSEVSFYVTVTDLSMCIAQVRYGTEEEEVCEQTGDVEVASDYKRYSFKFTMPGHDVTLEAGTAVEYNSITRIGDEHSKVRLINSIKKDNNGDPLVDEDGEYICENYYGQLVKFVYEVELGYNFEVTVVGDRTGAHYESKIYFEDNSYDPSDCWVLEMPAEPITFTISSTEKNDFVGKAFVGDYKGFFIDTKQPGKLTRESSPNLEASLKSNTVFTFKTTDVNAYDFKGTFTFDESASRFAYERESCDQYGISGKWDEKMTMTYVSDIIEDMPDNTRFYVMTQKSISDYTSAANAGATKLLLEMTLDGSTVYYLFERSGYSLREVGVEFTSGTSLGDASATAFVIENSEKILKYTYDGNTTSLIEKGREAGSYQPASGSGDVLELDGFGSGKIGSKEGTYTIVDGIVTLNCSGEETKYNIDMNAKTYTAINDEGTWDGPTSFYVEGSDIAYNGSKMTKGSVKVTLDPAQTKATFVAQYYSDMYRMEDAVNSTVSYIYDAASSTLTLSQILVGVYGTWNSERVDIVFSVSSDKQTLTFTGIERICSISNPSKYYVMVTDLAVPAQQ